MTNLTPEQIGYITVYKNKMIYSISLEMIINVKGEGLVPDLNKVVPFSRMFIYGVNDVETLEELEQYTQHAESCVDEFVESVKKESETEGVKIKVVSINRIN